jgi:hypothetical protein
MIDRDFKAFVERYQSLRLGSMDCEFVILWRAKLSHFDIRDLLAAALDVAGDPRADFPMNDLSLLIEHASNRRDERLRPTRSAKRFDYGPKPQEPAPPAWDQTLVRLGIIDSAEAKRRQREREKTK